jgi:hypothetical protein
MTPASEPVRALTLERRDLSAENEFLCRSREFAAHSTIAADSSASARLARTSATVESGH